MPSTAEVQAARAERRAGRARYYTRDRLGRLCVVCRSPMDALLASLEPYNCHPACDPREERLMAGGVVARKHAALVEDVEYLLSWGACPGEIAARLGYKVPLSLARQLHRIGRHDLAGAFARRAAA